MTTNIQEQAKAAVELAIKRHGGMKRWEEVDSILVEAYTMGGFGMSRRGLENDFPMPKKVRLNPKKGTAILYDYPEAGRDSIYDNGKVTDVVSGETPVFDNDNHREKMMSVSRFRRSWDTLDATYFFGYAMIHYASLPYTLLDTKIIDVKTRSNGDWRTRIDIENPEGAHTHSKFESLYFDESGLLIRHDYCAEVSSPLAKAANFLVDYENVDGYLITKRRKVHFRLGRLKTPLIVMDAGIKVLEITNHQAA